MRKLSGITDMVTSIAKSTPVTQASQLPMPVHSPLCEKDMVEPKSSEKARAAFLEQQMQEISSVRLPAGVPPVENKSLVSTELASKIRTFCKE